MNILPMMPVRYSLRPLIPALVAADSCATRVSFDSWALVPEGFPVFVYIGAGQVHPREFRLFIDLVAGQAHAKVRGELSARIDEGFDILVFFGWQPEFQLRQPKGDSYNRFQVLDRDEVPRVMPAEEPIVLWVNALAPGRGFGFDANHHSLDPQLRITRVMHLDHARVTAHLARPHAGDTILATAAIAAGTNCSILLCELRTGLACEDSGQPEGRASLRCVPNPARDLFSFFQCHLIVPFPKWLVPFSFPTPLYDFRVESQSHKYLFEHFVQEKKIGRCLPILS